MQNLHFLGKENGDLDSIFENKSVYRFSLKNRNSTTFVIDAKKENQHPEAVEVAKCIAQKTQMTACWKQ